MSKFLKKSLLLVLTINIGVLSRLHATDILDNENIFQSFSMAKYNALPCVEEANKNINKNKNFESFFLATQKLVHEYDVQPFFGIRLLHNHTKLQENTCMVESLEGTTENIEFITKTYSLSSSGKIAPASWIPTQNGYVPFEYSDEKQAIELSEKLIKSADFMIKFHSILKTYDMIDSLGPAIISSSKLQNHAEDISLVEDTFIQPFQSVISFQDIRNFEAEELIATFWMFNSPKQHWCLSRCQQVIKCKTNPKDRSHFRYWDHNKIHLKR